MNKNLNTEKRNRRTKRLLVRIGTAAVMATLLTVSAFAADPVLPVLDNMTDFVFSLVRALGVIMTIAGFVLLAMSVFQQDPHHRAQGITALIIGIVITFTKEILQGIGAI
ncbi:MAG: formate hydrogenlyase [Oscillospiraceae bacterium]|nr:formate hydrogenlyase [Oscillospiraceae bacterium]